jgi:hypothetical protein
VSDTEKGGHWFSGWSFQEFLEETHNPRWYTSFWTPKSTNAHHTVVSQNIKACFWDFILSVFSQMEPLNAIFVAYISTLLVVFTYIYENTLELRLRLSFVIFVPSNARQVLT